ncbi:hypothetical protein MNBD_GAMMA18-484 [hydrothermal vent metagenome]|uniref:Lipocalin-like domain-containing protein n=1 Tax=hydrothermal vent metagenome TaxID=652676 RepID=A0A3B0ZDA5_9ZZZZ
MKLFAALLTTLLITGCGGDGDGDGDGTVTELEGAWIETCHGLTTGYEIESATFAGNTFTISQKKYSDSACTVVNGTNSATGTFTIENSITASSGLSAKEIDVTILVINGSDASITFYDIFRIDGDKLYFGDAGEYDENEDDWEYSGITEEKRPIDLDFSWYYTKE